MNFKNRRRLKVIRSYIIGWTIAIIFMAIVRGVGTTENGQLNFEFWDSIRISLIMGPLFGAISGSVQLLVEERFYKRMSIKKLLLLNTIYFIIFLALLISTGFWLTRLLFGVKLDFITFAFDEGSGAIYFYILVVDIFMSMLRQVNLLLGEGKLSQLLRGKFYNPREEERIFMFLDLKSSTQLAEQLGHIRYSRLIQDCFNDLGVVVENEAEIYQYVGDEVVLTWKMKNGLRNQNCINAFFHYREQLEKRKDYYLEEYHTHPFFKAGMHLGIVTVTEVGKYKKEIAYHGDTLNTAARIQSKCNDFERELLISKELADRMNDEGQQYENMGFIPLRGKKDSVEIFSVALGK